MDTISDREVEAIWDRVKRYINPKDMSGKSPDDMSVEIENELMSAGREKDKQGDLETLRKAGFSDRVVELERVRNDLRKSPQKIPKTKDAKINKVVKISGKKIRSRANNKYAIETRVKVRVLSKRTTIIKEGNFKGKPAYYVYNTRLKRRITWGLL